MCGDFNDLETTEITTLLPLEQIINFATRGEITLDKIFTYVQEYIDCGCISEPPILNNDHCAVALPPVQRIRRPKHITVKKHLVTPKSKLAISEELNSYDWDFIHAEPNVDKKVELLQHSMSELFNKNCPIRHVRKPIDKPVVTLPLIQKLNRAKQRARKKGNPSWKFLSKFLQQQMKSGLQKLSNNNINNAVRGSHNWWQNVKTITGESKQTNQSEVINIAGEWLMSDQFVDKLNT